MAAMKAMRAMKKKAVSKIAKGKLAKLVVFRGNKTKTTGGLTKTDLVQNKRGKIVSKAQNAAGKKAFANIKGWTSAVKKGEDRQQGPERGWQEGLREHQGLDLGGEEGP